MEPQDILSSEDSVQRKNMSNTADNNVVTDSEMNAVSSSVDSPEVVCEAAPSDSEVVRADSVSGIYSREQIIERIKALLEMPVEEVKDEIDALKQLYYKQRKNEIEEAHRKYDEKTDGEKRGDTRYGYPDGSENRGYQSNRQSGQKGRGIY